VRCRRTEQPILERGVIASEVHASAPGIAQEQTIQKSQLRANGTAIVHRRLPILVGPESKCVTTTRPEAKIAKLDRFYFARVYGDVHRICCSVKPVCLCRIEFRNDVIVGSNDDAHGSEAKQLGV